MAMKDHIISSCQNPDLTMYTAQHFCNVTFCGKIVNIFFLQKNIYDVSNLILNNVVCSFKSLDVQF